jgi:hypothetical protein
VVIVEDEDLAMPLEGAVISPRGGGQFVCDEDGRALVVLPDDRQTVISISYPGYETLRLTVPAAGTGGSGRFTAKLRLGGSIMQSQELVIEAARPETSETRSGRSVAISERELTRTAEIGIVEDVMNSVKLLPGVGYSGMFNAMPSIRGGDPGDLMAALDGFYLERPYHWLGSISIFDPKMVSSARLSHGVFSTRYGHTISGLLEVTSKSPSSTETELEAAIGTSAASVNLSIPFNGKGGFLFMGKVTYWDTLVAAAKGLSTVVEDENLALINAVSTSPYIRSAALSMNYRITPDMEWRLNGFFGGDGVGADFKTDYEDNDGVQGSMEMKADYDNYQGFLISGLTSSPIPTLALRFTGGVGFMRTITNDRVDNKVTVKYNDSFKKLWDDKANEFNALHNPFFPIPLSGTFGDEYTAPNVNVKAYLENTAFNAQARADADWDLGHGFIAAFGVQELYSLWVQKEEINLSFMEFEIANLLKNQDYLSQVPQEIMPFLDFLATIPHSAIVMSNVGYPGDSRNQGFTTSGFGLLEYASPNQRFGAELGLRIEHLYLLGKNFGIQTIPAFDPRLNFDYNVLKNRGVLDSLNLTFGTGLFSSLNSFFLSYLEGTSGMGDFDIKFNRAWTSVVGVKVDMLRKYSFNIEGYYKRVFDRSYITADIPFDGNITWDFHSDGIGNIWGFDLQLQKLESRYWDGWISYSFNWARYFNPEKGDVTVSLDSISSNGGMWYYPSFHRFHNCNIVLNIKPLNWFNIGVRFGFASGQPRNKVDDTIYSYPVLMINENGVPVIIQKYDRDSWYDENERTAWSLPLDLKFSFFLANRNGRTGMEIYLAGENILSLVYKPAGRTTFNDYTGKEDTGGGSGAFDLPIPLVSFGFKWRY